MWFSVGFLLYCVCVCVCCFTLCVCVHAHACMHTMCVIFVDGCMLVCIICIGGCG